MNWACHDEIEFIFTVQISPVIIVWHILTVGELHGDPKYVVSVEPEIFITRLLFLLQTSEYETILLELSCSFDTNIVWSDKFSGGECGGVDGGGGRCGGNGCKGGWAGSCIIVGAMGGFVYVLQEQHDK